MRRLKSIMVTGGCGFIGSNFIRYLFQQNDFNGLVVNVDKLTYAGNPDNLTDVVHEYGGSRYEFIHADICDYAAMDRAINMYEVDTIVNFAAESHVDRSISGPGEFIQTNIVGTFTLLETARNRWIGRDDALFHHVSTDEVYGSLGETGYFHEYTPYDPRSPYSASKASSDHLVKAYHHTYGVPVTISNCTNNYGPFQFPEKLIPLMILNMLEGKTLPVYGDGMNIRDWLFVDDHNAAIWAILTRGKTGETYNIGGENEWPNIKLVEYLCELVSKKTGKSREDFIRLITYVKDRPGHDRRYAINCDKIKQELGWAQFVSFEKGLDITVDWYCNNRRWIDRVRSGEYADWVEKNYNKR